MLRSSLYTLSVCLILLPIELSAQEELKQALAEPVLSQEEADGQITRYLLDRIKPLELGSSLKSTELASHNIRQAVLDQVVFRGVPDAWRNHKVKVHDDKPIHTEHGYSIRRIRYEALPGLWIPALIYTPDELNSKTPVLVLFSPFPR